MTTLYVSPSCLRHNPNRPPIRERRGWRAPFRYDVCRWVLCYRLLGYDVKSVSTITGVAAENVKTILQIFGGHMPRRSRGFGSIIYNRGYAISTEEAYKRMALPSFIPMSVDHASGGFFSTPEDVHPMTFKLPEPEWRPEHDGYSDWQSRDWLI